MVRSIKFWLLIIFSTTTITVSYGQCLLNELNGFKFFIAKKEYDFKAKHLGEFHEFSSPFGADSLTMIYWCKNDTMYWTRKPLLINPANNLYMIFGVHKTPMNLKIGQSLEPVSDYLISSPMTQEGRSNVQTMYSNFYSGQRYDILTTTINTFNVATKTTVNMSGENVSYMNSKVVGVEEITIGDKKYQAYKVDYEVWLKTDLKVEFEYNGDGMKKSDQQQVEKQNAQINQKLAKQMAKFKNASTSNKGYTVMPRTDWFVPGIGWVRAHTFNSSRMFETDKAYITTLY